MAVILIISIFVSTSLSLNFITTKKYKLSGICNIVSLCLVVALATQLNLMTSVMIVCLILCSIIACIKIYLNSKTKTKENV